MSNPLTSPEVIALTKQHNYGTWRKQKLWNPSHLVSADGCYFTDGNGKRFLDFASQLICMNLGHNHRAVIPAIVATGDPRRWPIEPGRKGGGVIFSPEVNCYNCPIKHTYPGCGIA